MSRPSPEPPAAPALPGTGELLGRIRSPWALEEYGALGERKLLAFDAADAGDIAADDLAALAACLRAVPCPVIAVGNVPAALLRGVDTLVADAGGLAPLRKNIEAFPLAAMTLVQLLRHNEEATPAQGLFAESLAYATLQGGPEFARVHREGLEASAADDAGPVLLASREGDRLTLRLNRPRARNAYNRAMRDALYEALQLLRADGSIVKASISGEGGCFCVGGDLGEFGRVPDPSTAHAIRSSRDVATALLELSQRLEFRLHRACVGSGIELPAFGARVVAAPDTFVQLPEILLGLLPGAGGSVSILRRVGRQRLAWLALSARRIRAQTGLEWGLFDAIE